MENVISEWLRCPVCGNKTRLKIRGDTELKYFSDKYKYRYVDKLFLTLWGNSKAKKSRQGSR